MNRIKWAEKKAYQLLDRLNISTIPIPVEDIAKMLDIVIIREEFDDHLSGMLYRDNFHTIIGVNSNHLEPRQRFTIAHEIGHFIMHEGEQVHIDENFRVHFRDITSSLATNMNEIEANAFAAALLMPENHVREAFAQIADGIESSNDDDQQIQLLAKQFNVSKQALLIRLGKLGLLV